MSARALRGLRGRDHARPRTLEGLPTQATRRSHQSDTHALSLGDDDRASRRALPDARDTALEDEVWLTRTVGLARARQLSAAALCVSDGRLLAEAAGPSHGLAAPDLVVLRRLVGAPPRRLTLYASLSSIDPHRALAYREIPLARVVLSVLELPAPETVAILSQRGVDVRVTTR